MKLFRKKSAKQNDARQAASQVSGRSEQKVFSYYTASHKRLTNIERKSQSKAAVEVAAKHGSAIREHWLGALIILVLVVSGLYILTLGSSARIVIEGTKYRPASEYQQLANTQLAANPLNRVKPTLRRAQIESKLKEQIPEAQAIIVSAPLLGNRPNVTIVVDEPAAVMQQPGEQDLIVSKRGRLLLAATQSSSTTDLPIIQNQSGVTGKPGAQFLRPDDMQYLIQVMGQVASSQSKASYQLPPQPREFTMVEPSRGPYKVRFIFNDTILQQFGALRAAQKKLEQLNQKPNEYIDARLANKVFYK